MACPAPRERAELVPSADSRSPSAASDRSRKLVPVERSPRQSAGALNDMSTHPLGRRGSSTDGHDAEIGVPADQLLNQSVLPTRSRLVGREFDEAERRASCRMGPRR